MFVNFAKKQSDNLEQQETSPACSMESPLQRLLSLLRPRAAPTELRALVVEEPEDLETDDEGLISFEEERVSRGAKQAFGKGEAVQSGPTPVQGGKKPLWLGEGKLCSTEGCEEADIWERGAG